MQSVVCTLFEGDYHYGVAALVNSLHKEGFRGDVYAGYRGDIPFWASSAPLAMLSGWEGSRTYKINKEINLHFLPLTTDYHFTNYKPDFMLNVWNTVAKEAKQMFYFDPDIIVHSPWYFFNEWVGCGVAVCEDVNSPLAEYHPRRVAWRKYFSTKGLNLCFKTPIYVNGGFVGVENQDFLQLWKQIQELMAPQIGGLHRSSLKKSTLLSHDQSALAPFGKTDQDALNAAIEAWRHNVSFMGKEGMAFKAGTVLMSHALGQPKPWNSNSLKRSIYGMPPRLVDRAYWNLANGIITSQSTYTVTIKKLFITLAAFIGRFYKRGMI